MTTALPFRKARAFVENCETMNALHVGLYHLAHYLNIQSCKRRLPEEKLAEHKGMDQSMLNKSARHSNRQIRLAWILHGYGNYQNGNLRTNLRNKKK